MTPDPTASMLANGTPSDPAAEKKRADDREIATKWLAAIGRRRHKEKLWRDKADKVVDRYRDTRDTTDDQSSKFNILWANTEVLKPAIFSRMPVADVRRRYLTKDPVARTAAMILERALSYCMDSYDFKDTLDRAEEDYLLPGRGQMVLCYKPYFQTTQVRQDAKPLPPDAEQKDTEVLSPQADGTTLRYPAGTQLDAQGAYAMVDQEEKIFEEVYFEYQEWKYYVFGDAKQRGKVPWEAYGDCLTKDEVRATYPDFADYDKLTYSDMDGGGYDEEQVERKCLVWRVWDKNSRKLIVVAEGYKDAPLSVADDPLGLENFFPAPEPLYALRTNGNCTPKPEYLMYQDQAIELDDLVNRQRRLTQQLKYRGVYDKQLDESAKIKDLTKAPDGTFLPVPNFRELAEKGGIENLIDTLPLEEIAQVLAWLAGRIEQLKQQIYEIYGISDIVRGATKPSETLGAQELKAQYAGMRISTRQERFQRFIRDGLRLKAEVIAEHFSPKTLQIMTGIQVVPDAIWQQQKEAGEVEPNTVSESDFMAACAMIRSDKLRGFRIDIETDSTIPVDRANEQQNRIAFIQAVGNYLQGILPAVESGAIPVKLAREGLLFVVRGFKVGTELEETLEELGANADEAQQLQGLKQQLAQLQQELADLQAENQRLKSDAAVKVQDAAVDSQIKQAEAQQDMQIEGAKAVQDIAIARAKARAQPSRPIA